jgi:hypothetical protein
MSLEPEESGSQTRGSITTRAHAEISKMTTQTIAELTTKTVEGACSLCDQANKAWKGIGRAECEDCDRRYGPECTNCDDHNGRACEKWLGAIFVALIGVVGLALAIIGCDKQATAATDAGLTASCSPIGSAESAIALTMVLLLIAIGFRYIWLVGLSCTCLNKENKGGNCHRIVALTTVSVSILAGTILIIATCILWFNGQIISPGYVIGWYVVAFTVVIVGSASCLFRRPIRRPIPWPRLCTCPEITTQPFARITFGSPLKSVTLDPILPAQAPVQPMPSAPMLLPIPAGLTTASGTAAEMPITTPIQAYSARLQDSMNNCGSNSADRIVVISASSQPLYPTIGTHLPGSLVMPLNSNSTETTNITIPGTAT